MKSFALCSALLVVLTTHAQVTNEIQKITPAISDPGNIYGLVFYPEVVAASDNYMVATYTGSTNDSLDSGTIYKKVNGVWELDTVLFSPGAPALFGTAACMNDDYLFISAPHDNTVAEQVGSVFVYHRTGNTWQLIQNIFPNNFNVHAHFGRNMSLSGDFLFVMDYQMPDGEASTEVYHLQNGQWTFTQSITGTLASRIETNGELAIIDGNIYNEEFELESYYFTYTMQDGLWIIADTISVADIGASFSVDFVNATSNRMVVHEDAGVANTFYFYQWQNNTWQPEDSLAINTTDAITSFSYYEDYLALGYASAHHNGNFSGYAEMYKRAEGGWTYLGEVVPSDYSTWDKIGRTMAISDGQLLLGSYDLQTIYMGAVYAFQIAGCDDPAACNYMPGTAVDTNGLCTYPGCTDDTSCNYDPLACAGGICNYGEGGDLDCSGTLDINDFLLLLEQFGCYSDCGPYDLDGDGVVGMSDIVLMMGLVD